MSTEDETSLDVVDTENDGVNGDISNHDEVPTLPKRFRGAVEISPERPSRDFGKIVENIIEQLNLMERANIEITIEIEANVPGGIEKGKQRVLLENSNTLRFKEVKLD